jgi:o-succinylbenzoate synthase
VIRLRAEIVPGGGALASPVSNARNTWVARRGLVLRLIDENGTVGQGEASPLPDFSADDLESTEARLRALAESTLIFDLEQPLSALLAEVGRLLPRPHAAARFAFETALLDLLGQRRHVPLWQLLASVPGAAERAPARLPLSALIDTTSEARAFRDAEAAIERGIGTLKLKLGRPGQPASELRIALALRAALGPKVRLRFDANRAWTPGEARITLQELAQADPEFVEEALEPAALVAAGRLPAPLALDESLLDADWLDRKGPELVKAGVTAVVLKPMLLGGFGACLRISARARELGLRVVASHLFDGPIALAATAALGLAAANADCASGLDRHAGLECWPRTPLAMITRSEVLPSDAPGLGLPLFVGSA